jgi:hypothetical protein
VDIARGEAVEGDLNRFIAKRDEARRRAESEARREEMWAEEVRKYNENLQSRCLL